MWAVLCHGALIDASWVVTAASCIRDCHGDCRATVAFAELGALGLGHGDAAPRGGPISPETFVETFDVAEVRADPAVYVGAPGALSLVRLDGKSEARPIALHDGGADTTTAGGQNTTNSSQNTSASASPTRNVPVTLYTHCANNARLLCGAAPPGAVAMLGAPLVATTSEGRVMLVGVVSEDAGWDVTAGGVSDTPVSDTPVSDTPGGVLDTPVSLRFGDVDAARAWILAASGMGRIPPRKLLLFIDQLPKGKEVKVFSGASMIADSGVVIDDQCLGQELHDAGTGAITITLGDTPGIAGQNACLNAGEFWHDGRCVAGYWPAGPCGNSWGRQEPGRFKAHWRTAPFR
ncbi:hypothetical protein T484DRAFT_1843661 [Baffinella frigidus]|nr:hypothetical protein T484DRAFT_1843661 [Cryptophyta sp. CCMP2293]